MGGGRNPGVAWERQPGEGREAFEAFRQYRDIEPRERSIDAAFCAATGQQKGNKRAAGRWTHWSREWEWVSRAEAYDRYLRDLELAAREEAIAKEQALWAERQREAREDEWRHSRMLNDKFRQMAQLPVVEQVVTDPQGRTVIIKPVRWTMANLGQLAEIASKLARQAAEMDTANQKADVRLQRDYENALVKLERELPAEVFAQVLKILAGENGAEDPP